MHGLEAPLLKKAKKRLWQSIFYSDAGDGAKEPLIQIHINGADEHHIKEEVTCSLEIQRKQSKEQFGRIQALVTDLRTPRVTEGTIQEEDSRKEDKKEKIRALIRESVQQQTAFYTESFQQQAALYHAKLEVITNELKKSLDNKLQSQEIDEQKKKPSDKDKNSAVAVIEVSVDKTNNDDMRALLKQEIESLDK